jgi:hypothetical protein
MSGTHSVGDRAVEHTSFELSLKSVASEPTTKTSNETPSGRAIRWPWLDRFVVTLACCMSFFVTMIATRRGLGLNPDSIYYISAGLNLAQGEGLTHLYGKPLTVFPPAMSAIIAAGTRVGINDVELLRGLHSLSFAAVVLLSYVLLRRHVASRTLILGTTIFIAASGVLLTLSATVLSEPLFLVVAMAFIIVLEDLLSRPRHIWLLASAIALSWLAFLLRYSGISFVPIGFAALLIGLRSVGSGFALKRAAIFSVCAASVPVAWMLRNRAIDGTLTGSRSPSVDGPAINAYRSAETVGRWFWLVPGPTATALAAAVGGLLLASLVAALWRLRTPESKTDGSSLVPVAVFTFGYAAYLIVAASLTAFNPIDFRLLSPIYAPLVILAAVALDRLWERLSPPKRTILAAVLVSAIALQALASFSVVERFAVGQGYAKQAWRNSDLAAIVARLPEKTIVFSNEPAGLWAQTRRDGIRMAPLRYSTVTWERGVDGVARLAACNPTVLAWFTNVDLLTPRGKGRDKPLLPFDLSSHVRLDLIQTAKDGALYKVAPSGESAVCNR